MPLGGRINPISAMQGGMAHVPGTQTLETSDPTSTEQLSIVIQAGLPVPATPTSDSQRSNPVRQSLIHPMKRSRFVTHGDRVPEANDDQGDTT